MPDTFARMRQLTGSTTEWAANDLVIGYGEVAVELTPSGDAKLKVGDGVRRFSALPYASSQAASVAWDNITGRPTTFPPSTHTHTLQQVTGLVDSGGKLSLTIMPQSIMEKMDWRGLHTPTLALEYPVSPSAGDTWGIAGPAYTFTTGPLAGKTVSDGSGIVFDNSTWFRFGGGAGVNPADFVQQTDLVTSTTGPPQAGKVPKLNTSGRLDPSFINVPGQLNFRGTVNITAPPPVGVNQGDYWLVGIGGVAHSGWTGIAGQTLAVNDQVIWNGVQWVYTHTAGAASGFVPIDGSAPMTGPLSLSVNASPAAAHAVRFDRMTSAIAAIPSAVAQLGYTPLAPLNNLNDVANVGTARANLGLGTAATSPTSAFLATSSNLADVPDKSVARGNLGLGTAATASTAAFLATPSNLADVPDKAAARANLGVPDLSDIILKSIVDAAGDLIVATGDNTPARFAKGAAGQLLRSTSTGLEWASGPGSIAFLAHLAATAGLPGNSVATTIICPTIIYNIGGAYNGTTGVFTVPAGGAGLYQVNTKAVVATDSGSTSIDFALQHTIASPASTKRYGCLAATFASFTDYSLSIVLNLAVGDSIGIFASNPSTTSAGHVYAFGNVSQALTTLSAIKIA